MNYKKIYENYYNIKILKVGIFNITVIEKIIT